MKHARLLASAAVLVILAGCASQSSDDGNESANASANAVTAGSASSAAVKAATGRDAVSSTPIYEPGTDAPAFFEVKLAGDGWAVVTTASPAHVVEYSLTGRSPTERLDLGTRAAMKKVFRLDAAVYVAADASGRALGRSTKSLLKIDRSGPTPTFVPITSDDAIAAFQVARTSAPPLIGDVAPTKTCAAAGDVPSYTQLDAGQGPNDTACFSGCGPTAWATIFGWASRRASENAPDATFAGLFPGRAEAPLAMDDTVASLSMTLNHTVGTFCSSGQGATTSWGMGDVKSYVAANAPGVTVDARYNILMMPDNGVRDAVIDAICDGRPSIIGIGTLFGGDGHFPIAKGYENGKFNLEMGWGGDGNGWYDATTWYMGSVRHGG